MLTREGMVIIAACEERENCEYGFGGGSACVMNCIPNNPKAN